MLTLTSVDSSVVSWAGADPTLATWPDGVSVEPAEDEVRNWYNAVYTSKRKNQKEPTIR